MRIFLSGKVDEENGSWRDALVKPVLFANRTVPTPPAFNGYLDFVRVPKNTAVPRWAIYVDHGQVAQWPIGKGWIFDGHDYVGPYRQVWREQDKYEGYFHGVMAGGQHGLMESDDQAVVVANCRKAIERADLVFAYLNAPDAYGTIAEIGYAAALGKFVSVLVRPGTEFDDSDFWFVQALATHVHRWPWQSSTDGLSEWEVIRATLKDAIVAHAARNQPPMQLPDQTIMMAISDSFSQIEQWTSDPRVRNEVQRMRQQVLG